MSRHTIPIGRILGISIDLDYSWFLVAGLLSWVLATSYYPSEFKNWSGVEYWFMGGITALLLFASVLLHELGHSIVAMHYKIQVPRITLFIFGGVSQIAGEPPSPVAEFWVAIAGPAVSVALAALFALLQRVLPPVSPLLALAKYLALINGMLAAFNLIPGFPLDGGRVFRAIVWGISRNSAKQPWLRRARDVSSASCSSLLACGSLCEETFSMGSGSRSSVGSWKAPPLRKCNNR